MKPSLLILAAGMGSRYGGIKQIEPVGANGEIILEYSVFDAIRANFGRVIFVIRKDIQKDFEDHVIPKFSAHIPCSLVFQDMTDLPSGYTVPSTRTKPWGTAHAVLAAKHVLQDSAFAVINADDFYGHEAFEVMAAFLSGRSVREKNYAMVGYELARTVSANGSVSRGICTVSEDNMLLGMSEHTKIVTREESIVSVEGGNAGYRETILPADTPVSMNFFGFTPAIFPEMEAGFEQFLGTSGAQEKAEYFIPLVVDTVINSDSSLRVLQTSAQWFGITYKEDRPGVEAGIRALVEDGRYPATLWRDTIA